MNIVGYVLYGNSEPDPDYDAKMNTAESSRQDDESISSITVNSDAWTHGMPLNGLTASRPRSSGFLAFFMSIILCVAIGIGSVILTPSNKLPFELPAQVTAFLHR